MCVRGWGWGRREKEKEREWGGGHHSMSLPVSFGNRYQGRDWGMVQHGAFSPTGQHEEPIQPSHVIHLPFSFWNEHMPTHGILSQSLPSVKAATAFSPIRSRGQVLLILREQSSCSDDRPCQLLAGERRTGSPCLTLVTERPHKCWFLLASY